MHALSRQGETRIYRAGVAVETLLEGLNVVTVFAPRSRAQIWLEGTVGNVHERATCLGVAHAYLAGLVGTGDILAHKLACMSRIVHRALTIVGTRHAVLLRVGHEDAVLASGTWFGHLHAAAYSVVALVAEGT